jgi:hypothetical protein
MPENTKKSSPAMILFAWLLVGVPLGWGIYNTALNSEHFWRSRKIRPWRDLEVLNIFS